ncbi:MAG: biotin/lipoyl-binding carrier protein [Geodermatophilaceae bacterium]|jgi:biotin carboxyl carrier protein|nr:biotin/lipoyl-binding carrier protein [Geodermatophilaceae bacterium]
MSRVVEQIQAEMVSNVLKIVVTVGDQIGPGDTVVILESMKMEIPVVCESGGVITEIAVHEGEVIQEGDLIAVIDSDQVAEPLVP